MANEIWISLWTYIILPLIPILGAMLVLMGRKKLQEWQLKIDSENLNRYIGLAGGAVLQAVECVYQTYVESLKKDGRFDKEAQVSAFLRAANMATVLITAESRKAIEMAYGDFNNWLDSKIEQMVKWNKDEENRNK